PPLEAVRLDDRVGDRVPLDLWFGDAAGRRLQLREMFDGERPVLLVLSYVRCRMLCSVVLRGATDAVRAMPLALGRDYRFVIASIDPHEESATAAAKLSELRTRVGDGVTYLLGAERPTRELADSVGFRYAWDARTEQYAHPAVVFVLTPDGTLASRVEGVTFDPAQLAGALREARRGELSPPPSSAADVLGCFRFDPAVREHREMIEGYLRFGGLAISVAMLSAIVLLFLWERGRRV
ncbi:MAG: SCO family protein, partial [Deltaproteobacteria bacterium]|nr:SCO family protein [Deltaproteobacteria bacterium]